MVAIVVQILTLIVALLGMYRAESRAGWRQVTLVALIILTVSSIWMTVQSNRDDEYIRWALEVVVGGQANEARREEIVQQVVEHAAAAGLPVAKRTNYDDGLQVLELYRDGSDIRGGLIAVNQDDIAKLAGVSPQMLSRAVSGQINRGWGTDSLDRDWNLVVSRIRDIAVHVFRSEWKGPSNIHVWADFDRKYIAVGPPDGDGSTPPGGRAEFPEAELRRLLTMSTFERGDTIARACSRLVKKS
jgi:hypothetical protein